MRAVRTLLVAVATAAFAAGCGGGGKSSADLCPAPTSATTVDMKDFEFAPLCLEVGAGDSITATNSGEAPHTYTVSEVDVNVDLGGGETETVELSGAAPGTYKVICTYHPQMVGALRVV